MPEALSYYNINKYRQYPFKNQKLLPLLDIWLQVPIGTTKVHISSINDTGITIACNEVDWITAPITTGNLIKLFDKETYVGYLVLDSELPLGVTYTAADTELLETTWVPEKLTGVRHIYVNGVKAGEVLNLTAGTNIYISGTTINNLTRLSYENYLKKLKIGNAAVYGKYLSIYGTNIIHISGSTFSTTITDATLKCIVVFTEGSRGDQGPQGPQGIPGVDGEVVYDYYNSPDGC